MKNNSFYSKSFIIGAVLIVLNLLIKGLFLTDSSIAGDEPFSIYHAQMDILSIIKELAHGNNPPLYEIFLHFWIKVFGITPFSVRFPSLIFSCITVLFVFKLGKRFFNLEIALFASLLFIFSNYQTIFAHEARAYALAGMLSVISMYYYLRILVNHKVKTPVLLSFLVSTILLIYSHYFGFFILIVQVICLLFNKELIKKYWKKFFIVGLIIILLYLPYIRILFNRALDSSINGTWLSPVKDLGNLHDVFHIFSNNNTLIYLVFITVFWLTTAILVYRSSFKVLKKPILFVIIPFFFLTSVSIYVDIPFIWRVTSIPIFKLFFILGVLTLLVFIIFSKHNKKLLIQTKVILFWFWFPLILMFILSLESFPISIPMFHDRYFIFFSNAFYFQLAILSILLINREKVKYVIPIIIILLFAVTTNPNVSNKRNAEETINKVITLKDDQTIIYISPSWFDLNFTYYYNIKYFKEYDKDLGKRLNRENIYPISNESQLEPEHYSQFEKIIFLDAGVDSTVSNNSVLQKLKDNTVLENSYEFEEIFKIYEFNLD